MDVQGLFTNIPEADGLEALEEALDERKDKTIPSGFLLRLMELILKYSIFTFNSDYFQQLIGAAMGSKPIPGYSNIFMAKKIDRIINMLADKNENALLLFKRFLDDLFFIFNGNSKQLHILFEDINKIHPAIKFTMEHTTNNEDTSTEKCDCKAKEYISFLDTSCRIIDGQIETDLHRKSTDRNQYLLPTSCHPKQTTASIPFSLSLRIVRNCSNITQRKKRLQEMKDFLLSRDYPEQIIDSAIERAVIIPREVALKKKTKLTKPKRPVFALRYDPRLPAITSIQAKHWRAMKSQDQYLAQVFPQPPLTGFKRQKNLREYLIRAKIPGALSSRPNRIVKGMQKCGKSCSACPYIKEGRNIKYGKQTWKINKKLSCNNYNIIYLIECNKDTCKQRYIGESKRPLRNRLAEHRGYIVNRHIDKATGAHFTSPGHSVSNLTITILEQVKYNNELYRKERERYFINKLNTYHGGLNRQI